MAYLKEHSIRSSPEEIVVEGFNGIARVKGGGATPGLTPPCTVEDGARGTGEKVAAISA